MTAPADTMQSPAGRPDAAAAWTARFRPLSWSVRRELWENRAVWRAPLIAAGLVLFALALSRFGSLRVDVNDHRQSVPPIIPYAIIAVSVLGAGLIIGAIYASGALLRERRDRSILFWKSLPVSNLTVVLSKAAVPMLVVPAVTIVTVILSHLLLLVVSTGALMAAGQDPTAARVDVLDILRLDGILLYGLVVLSLWQAPVWGYLLAISAWAKARPLLWAVGPWIALSVMEKIVFGAHSGYIGRFVNDRLFGGLGVALSGTHGEAGLNVGAPNAPHGFSLHGDSGWPQLHPIAFLASPELWIGLLAAAALFVAAAWLRRRADPI
jgi:ABC-2 type transport system permease protein